MGCYKPWRSLYKDQILDSYLFFQTKRSASWSLLVPRAENTSRLIESLFCQATRPPAWRAKESQLGGKLTDTRISWVPWSSTPGEGYKIVVWVRKQRKLPTMNWNPVIIYQRACGWSLHTGKTITDTGGRVKSICIQSIWLNRNWRKITLQVLSVTAKFVCMVTVNFAVGFFCLVVFF